MSGGGPGIRLLVTTPSTTPDTPTAFKKVLTTPLLYFFILGDVLGAGVYVLVGQVAADSGGAVWAPLIVALCLALLTAASYAELVTKYPRAGGASHYATLAYGPFAGFLAGFCMLAAGVVSVGALARGFGGDYLAEFISLPVVLVAVVFLTTLALINARGISESTRSNVVATVTEVGGLLLVIGLGTWVVLRGDGDMSRLTDLGTTNQGPTAALLSGAVLAYYSFVGFETSVNVAEETRNPRRSYPTALFGALITAGAVYVLVGAAAAAAVPTAELADSSGPLLEVVRVAGGVPTEVFSAIALVAVANGALLTGIMSSRLAYGMARDGLLPSFLAKVLPGRRTPGRRSPPPLLSPCSSHSPATSPPSPRLLSCSFWSSSSSSTLRPSCCAAIRHRGTTFVPRPSFRYSGRCPASYSPRRSMARCGSEDYPCSPWVQSLGSSQQYACGGTAPDDLPGAPRWYERAAQGRRTGQVRYAPRRTPPRPHPHLTWRHC